MPIIRPAALERELRRWMRPDAHRFISPGWRRVVRPGSEAAAVFGLYEAKYRPDQPRVPAGVPEGGRWTDESGAGQRASRPTPAPTSVQGRNDPRILSDANPDSDAQPGARYAQGRRPGTAFGRVVINGRVVEPTPGQAARLAVVEAQARDATQRVQQYDRNWSPSAETYENVEALISAYQSQAQEARARLRELQQLGVGPGPFAHESIPAGRSVTASDRIELKRMFDQYGCHTCGTFEPGTVSGNPVGDHQPSSAFYWLRSERRLYPQCLYCSLRQGGVVNGLLRR